MTVRVCGEEKLIFNLQMVSFQIYLQTSVFGCQSLGGGRRRGVGMSLNLCFLFPTSCFYFVWRLFAKESRRRLSLAAL